MSFIKLEASEPGELWITSDPVYINFIVLGTSKEIRCNVSHKRIKVLVINDKADRVRDLSLHSLTTSMGYTRYSAQDPQTALDLITY